MTEIPPSLKNLKRRTVLPLIRKTESRLAPARFAIAKQAIPDPANIQGDVYLLFPKVAECFLFFWIEDKDKFKAALRNYRPTSSEDVAGHLETISDAKERGQIADLFQTQIAFSRSGLTALGRPEAVGDIRYDGGSMRRDKGVLGDGRQWDPIFDPGTVHGVFVVAAANAQKRSEALTNIKDLFGGAVRKFRSINADRRTGKNKGHEHFGYEDGVSQPAIRGLAIPRKGQLEVDPGVIIMGYKGDPVFDSTDPNVTKRPYWTKDGSLMVFRKLEQDVKGFEDYLTQNANRWRDFWPPGTVGQDLTPKEGADLWGARMIGRWKSGCPIALSPYRDNPDIAADPDQVNNFDYTVPNQTGPSDIGCPFVAHTRKTAPRNLDPFVSKKYLESAVIVRAGMPYGKDYSEAPLDTERGLAFVCYSSSITNGFFLQTTGFAGNDYFPTSGVIPFRHGQDPILGGPGDMFDAAIIGDPDVNQTDKDIVPNKEITIRVSDKTGKIFQVSGVARPEDVTAFKQDFFVTSRGGEYFFVPSVETVKLLAGA
ncbi:unnamed protein product [Somion occarium]|uniref:DyP dimeric alpha+beta barrel domain-containing protein n=1 Tax=Somion occarium TaxID=3059160 RepID=A0ABP1DYC9_9APHY